MDICKAIFIGILLLDICKVENFYLFVEGKGGCSNIGEPTCC